MQLLFKDVGPCLLSFGDVRWLYVIIGCILYCNYYCSEDGSNEFRFLLVSFAIGLDMSAERRDSSGGG